MTTPQPSCRARVDAAIARIENGSFKQGEVPPLWDGHATERILTQMVELAVSVNSHIAAAVLGRGPGSYRESFTDLARAGVITEQFAAQLAPSAGLRNILAHEYVAIDLQLVAAAIPAAISDYTAYVKAVATWLVDR